MANRAALWIAWLYLSIWTGVGSAVFLGEISDDYLGDVSDFTFPAGFLAAIFLVWFLVHKRRYGWREFASCLLWTIWFVAFLSWQEGVVRRGFGLERAGFWLNVAPLFGLLIGLLLQRRTGLARSVAIAAVSAAVFVAAVYGPLRSFLSSQAYSGGFSSLLLVLFINTVLAALGGVLGYWLFGLLIHKR